MVRRITDQWFKPWGYGTPELTTRTCADCQHEFIVTDDAVCCVYCGDLREYREIKQREKQVRQANVLRWVFPALHTAFWALPPTLAVAFRDPKCLAFWLIAVVASGMLEAEREFRRERSRG